jgi:hypothetical protein
MTDSIDHISLAFKTCAGEHFKSEYVTPETLEEYSLEGLGISISQWSDWDVIKVLKIFSAALEDMNRHSKCAIIDDWIEEIQRGDEKSDCIILS